MTPEGKVKKECRAYLKSIGAYVFSPVQMGYGAPALDDYICFRGAFVGIEYKRAEGGKLTLRQESTIASILRSGGRAIVICSAEELKRWFVNNWALSTL